MRLGREVDDGLTAGPGSRYGTRVADVALDELAVAALEVRAVARVRQLVEDDDLVALAASRFAKWEPMNPAPPVTRTRTSERLASGGDRVECDR